MTRFTKQDVGDEQKDIGQERPISSYMICFITSNNVSRPSSCKAASAKDPKASDEAELRHLTPFDFILCTDADTISIKYKLRTMPTTEVGPS